MRVRYAATLLVVLGAAGAAGAGDAAAQARRGPVLLEVPVSVRAAALGHAFPLGSVDASAIFHNAANAESLRGMAAAAHDHGGRSTLYAVAAGLEWWGGAVAVGLQTASYLPEPGTDGDGAGQLFGSGSTPVAEAVASAALSRRIRGIQFAATGKWLEQRAGDERNSSVAADLATAVRAGPFLVGLAVQNLGPAMNVGESDVPLPDRVTLGIASPVPLPVGPFDLLAAAAVGRDTRGDFFSGGGMELSWWPVVGRTLSLRVGSVAFGGEPNAGRLTLGAGFTGDRIALDYSHQAHEEGDVHRFGLRWR
jgi:hypothetical protein